MTRKKQARTQLAENRRQHLDPWNLQIPSQPSLRALKPSVRKRLERERATELRVLPWVQDPAWRLGARTHPPATLVGLPAELRQQILYESCDVSSLEDDFWKERFPVVHHSSTGKAHMFAGRGMQKLRSGLGRRARGLIILLCRRIGALCCVAPLVRLDMRYVSKRWQSDLERYIEGDLGIKLYGPAPSLPVAAKGYSWMFDDEIDALMQRRRKGREIAAKSRQVRGKRLRSWKCWYCSERHPIADSVCPPARRDRAKWEEMTKEIGGRRGSAKPTPTFKGTKIVFSD